MADEKMDQDAYSTTSTPGDSRKVGMSTFLIHGTAQTARWDFSHHTVPPLSSSVTYRLDSAERGGRGFLQFGRGREGDAEPVYIYDRLDEPTRSILEDDLARAEGGEICCTFATGMAAISAALGILLKPGDHIVAFGTIYGCTYSLLTRWLSRQQIATTFCDFTALESVRAAIRPETRVLYAETPANPTMEIVDLGALCGLRDEINATRPDDRKIHVLIDNTFASPYCQRPLEWGVDLSIESLTKNICGFGTDMGGAVIGAKRYEEDLFMYRKDFGGVLSPKSAWAILVYGLSTLTLRVKRQIDTAFKVAEFLERHPKIGRVYYPGPPQPPAVPAGGKADAEHARHLRAGDAPVLRNARGGRGAPAGPAADQLGGHAFVLHHPGGLARQHPHPDRGARHHDACRPAAGGPEARPYRAERHPAVVRAGKSRRYHP